MRAYLNRSRIEILSSTDTDSSFKPRKKKLVRLCNCWRWHKTSCMPISSPYANTRTATQDAAGRGSGHPSRIIPSHSMTVLKEKGSVEPVIFYSLSENGGNYHYIQILTVFFKGRRNFCMLMPIRMYLRHLRSKTEGHQSVCQVHGLSARCAWDRKQASWICQWFYEKH